jgi:hypothetical protein
MRKFDQDPVEKRITGGENHFSSLGWFSPNGENIILDEPLAKFIKIAGCNSQ